MFQLPTKPTHQLRVLCSKYTCKTNRSRQYTITYTEIFLSDTMGLLYGSWLKIDNGSTANAVINYGLLLHAVKCVAIAPIDDNRLSHFLGKQGDVQIFYFRPFCENKTQVCSIQGFLDGIAIFDVAQRTFFEIFCPNRVPSLYMCPIVQHNRDVYKGRRFPKVVRTRLEGQSQNGNGQTL